MQLIDGGKGRDYIPTEIEVCKSCEATFRYDARDLYSGGYGGYWVYCPQCGNRIVAKSLHCPTHLRPRPLDGLRRLWSRITGAKA